MHSTHNPSSITRNLAEKHTFSSKERDAETGLSYFGARYYSSDLSIWLSVDPMADKYPSMSPYVYCANNPVKLVDPNGEDYEVVVDEKNHTMTIRAIYYTATENKEKLQKGLDLWNSQSGKFSYVTGKGHDKQSYTINFDLTIAEGDFDENQASSAFNSNKSGVENFMSSANDIVNENGETVNGKASNNHILFRAEASSRTISHEIGHTLGIGDWQMPGADQEDKGQLMTSGGNSNVINRSHIATLLAVKGYCPPSSHTGISINIKNDFKVLPQKAQGVVRHIN